MFLAYAIIERLSEEKPVAVKVSYGNSFDNYVILSEDGVAFHIGTSKWPLREYGHFLWAFSDSGGKVSMSNSCRHSLTLLVYRCLNLPMPFKTILKFMFFKPLLLLGTVGMNGPNKAKSGAVSCILHPWRRLEIWHMFCYSSLYNQLIGTHSSHFLEFDGKQMKSFAAKWGCVPRTVQMLCESLKDETGLNADARNAVVLAVSSPLDHLHAIVALHIQSFPGASIILFTRPNRISNGFD